MLPSQYVAQGWTQNQTARDGLGRSTKPNNIDAQSWDILGALIASHRSGMIDLQQSDQIKQYINDSFQINFITWNDMKTRQQKEVVEILQQAEQNLCLV